MGIFTETPITGAFNETPNTRDVSVNIENYDGDKPIEVVIRKELPEQVIRTAPMRLPEGCTFTGNITTPRVWLEHRAGLINMNNAHIDIDRENLVIKLTINETNSCPSFKENQITTHLATEMTVAYAPRTVITGEIKLSDTYSKLNINNDTFVTPQKLAKFLRVNKHLFADKEEGMAFISALKHVKAKITGDYEKNKELQGRISKVEYMSQEVAHNIPENITLLLDLFKGMPKQKYVVEIDADIVDGEIMVSLISPSINEKIEEVRDEAINNEISQIQAAYPRLLIIE